MSGFWFQQSLQNWKKTIINQIDKPPVAIQICSVTFTCLVHGFQIGIASACLDALVWLERQPGPSLMKLNCFQSNLLSKTSKKLFSLKSFWFQKHITHRDFTSFRTKVKSPEKLAKLTKTSEIAKFNLLKMS